MRLLDQPESIILSKTVQRRYRAEIFMVIFLVKKLLTLRYGRRSRFILFSLVIPSVGMASLVAMAARIPRRKIRAAVARPRVRCGRKLCGYGWARGIP